MNDRIFASKADAMECVANYKAAGITAVMVRGMFAYIVRIA